MATKHKHDDEDGGDIFSLFDMTDEKYEELWKKFEHAKIESKDIAHLAELLNIKESGELGVLSFLLGREIERNNRSIEIEEMLKEQRR